MAYLTYDEFQALPFGKAVELQQSEFDRYEWFAEQAINQVTRFYYELNLLEDDADEFRVSHFKRAVALQVIKQADDETLTADEADSDPQSFTMGRTSINYGAGSASKADDLKSDVSKDAIRQLIPTGLLYRGV